MWSVKFITFRQFTFICFFLLPNGKIITVFNYAHPSKSVRIFVIRARPNEFVLVATPSVVALDRKIKRK